MKSGRTLWQELNRHYNMGVRTVESYLNVWLQMRPNLLSIDNGDAQRWDEVNNRLVHQVENAREWRKVCLEYFQTFSKQPIVDNE